MLNIILLTMPNESSTRVFVLAYCEDHPFKSYAKLMHALSKHAGSVIGHLVAEYDNVIYKLRATYIVQWKNGRTCLTPITESTYYVLKEIVSRETFEQMNNLVLEKCAQVPF